MFNQREIFERVKNSNIISRRSISKIYKIDEKDVVIIYYNIVNTVKITIKKKICRWRHS